MCIVHVIDVGHTTGRSLVGGLYVIWGTEPLLRDRKTGNDTFSLGKENMTAGVAYSVRSGLRVPVGSRDFLFSSNHLDPAPGRSFSVVKRQKRDVCIPPPRVEIKDG